MGKTHHSTNADTEFSGSQAIPVYQVRITTNFAPAVDAICRRVAVMKPAGLADDTTKPCRGSADSNFAASARTRPARERNSAVVAAAAAAADAPFRLRPSFEDALRPVPGRQARSPLCIGRGQVCVDARRREGEGRGRDCGDVKMVGQRVGRDLGSLGRVEAWLEMDRKLRIFFDHDHRHQVY